VVGGQGREGVRARWISGYVVEKIPVLVRAHRAVNLTAAVVVGSEMGFAPLLDEGQQAAEVGAGQAGDEAGEAQRDGLRRLPECFVVDVQGRDGHGRCSAGGVGYRSTSSMLSSLRTRRDHCSNISGLATSIRLRTCSGTDPNLSSKSSKSIVASPS
jgi:hypothetical protein